MKFYVLFDNIAEKLIDVFLANNDDEEQTCAYLIYGHKCLSGEYNA